MLFFLLISVKMPTIVGILTFTTRKYFMLHGLFFITFGPGCALHTFVGCYVFAIFPPFFSAIPTKVALECQSYFQLHRYSFYKSSCHFLHLLKFILNDYFLGHLTTTIILHTWHIWLPTKPFTLQ